MSRQAQKAQTRQRMVDAAARGFREGGYGVGVDRLARQAGVTSGAFYVHFENKADAFLAAMEHGLDELLSGVHQHQAEHGPAWWAAFVRFYLGPKRACTLADSCSLQSLAPELARADDGARHAFECRLAAVVQAVVAGPRSAGAPRDAAAAYAALATLVGAVTLARAVQSSDVADQIAAAAGRQLLGARWDAP